MMLRICYLLAVLCLLGQKEALAARKLPGAVVQRSAERILPLGAAEVTELHGAAFVMEAGKTQARPLRIGEPIPGGQLIETGDSAESRLELHFADGSVIRLGRSTKVMLLPNARQVALHRGRMLVAADRMLGSIAVLTRRLSFLPEGTTYLVELDDSQRDKNQEARSALTVLEGVVFACSNAATPPGATSAKPRRLAPATPKDILVLPGERLESGQIKGPPRPVADSLSARMNDEPLIVQFSRRLPTWLRIDELADQQRRRVLFGRNARLRREIFWKRPPRPPIKLPPLFADPDSVTVHYDYPL